MVFADADVDIVVVKNLFSVLVLLFIFGIDQIGSMHFGINHHLFHQFVQLMNFIGEQTCMF